MVIFFVLYYIGEDAKEQGFIVKLSSLGISLCFVIWLSKPRSQQAVSFAHKNPPWPFGAVRC